MVPEQITEPNTADIRRDLAYMTARWGELSAPAAIELRAFARGKQPHTGHFSPDDLDEAAEWAASMNSYGLNLYAVRNPVSASVVGSATDEDILAAFFLWADCDDQASTGNVQRFDGPKWSASVITGTTPTVRVHAYWQLEQPCTDLAAWRDMQKAIAAHFGSDNKVINPSRVMRLGGTVSYPDPQKQSKGYIKEVATIRTEYEDARPPVTFDQMARVFQSSTPQKLIADNWIEGTPALDREAAATRAMSGQDWHNEVIRLVASYVAKGMSDGEIHTLTDPLTLSGYSVDQTRAEVQKAIDGARAKGWTPEPKAEVQFDAAPAADAKDVGWQMQSAADFTADFVAPEYLIDGVVQRGRLYTLTAPTGSGKTAVMLAIGISMSRGENVCERETEIGDVIYMAGENPDDVRARLIATMEAQNVNPAECRLHFIPGTFSIRQDMAALRAAIESLPNVTMIVVDTLAAYFDGDDNNSNAQMLDFARVLRNLTMAKSKPAVIVPAHPVKNAAKNNLTPMGGSALLNEVDGNLCIWKRETAVEMHWQGKHRGAEFEPLLFELKGVESDKVRDSKGRIMPTVMAVPLMETRRLEIATLAVSMEDRLLLNIEAYEGQSIADRCVEIGLINAAGGAKRTTMVRMLEKLQGEKLIERLRSNWRLTAKGEEAVTIIKNGGFSVDPDA